MSSNKHHQVLFNKTSALEDYHLMHGLIIRDHTHRVEYLKHHHMDWIIAGNAFIISVVIRTLLGSSASSDATTTSSSLSGKVETWEFFGNRQKGWEFLVSSLFFMGSILFLRRISFHTPQVIKKESLQYPLMKTEAIQEAQDTMPEGRVSMDSNDPSNQKGRSLSMVLEQEIAESESSLILAPNTTTTIVTPPNPNVADGNTTNSIITPKSSIVVEEEEEEHESKNITAPRSGKKFQMIPEVNIFAPPIDETARKLIKTVRGMIEMEKPNNYDELVEHCCTDDDIWRYLVARKMNVKAAYKQLLVSLEYRNEMKPHLIRWPDISKESVTGKVVLNQRVDRWGRAVITLDNFRENTTDALQQMKFLSYTIEHALRLMRKVSGARKYVICVRLGELSAFNFHKLPSPSITRETIKLIMNVYCECLGTAILYQPPAVFAMFLRIFESMLDAKQMGKVVWVRGNMTRGSPNDLFLKDLLGDHWREYFAEDAPPSKYGPNVRPAFEPEEYATFMQSLDNIR